MAEKEQSYGIALSTAIRAQRQSMGVTDRSSLSDSLVKSPLWKKNALQTTETVRPGDPGDGTPAVLHTLKQSLLELVERHWQELVENADLITQERLIEQLSNPASNEDDAACREASMQQESDSMREALALHVEEVKDAKRQLHKQAATLQKRSEEIEQLQQTIVNLEAENARLSADNQDELDTQRTELLEFQAAYDQFQQQSDLVLNELDQENERLRTECRHQNRRSLL